MRIARQTVKLLHVHPNATPMPDVVAPIARVSHRSAGDDDAALCEKLVAWGHLSVFEHKRYAMELFGLPSAQQAPGIALYDGDEMITTSFNHRHIIESGAYRDAFHFIMYDELTAPERFHHAAATFEISGISRACSHQLVRHRMASFTQESQRYVDMSDPEAVLPDSIAADPDSHDIFTALVEDDMGAYAEMTARGILKEDARFVLPNAIATRIVVTMTFEWWRHFLELRLDPHAQWEIRAVAEKVRDVLREVDAENFGDL